MECIKFNYSMFERTFFSSVNFYGKEMKFIGCLLFLGQVCLMDMLAFRLFYDASFLDCLGISQRSVLPRPNLDLTLTSKSAKSFPSWWIGLWIFLQSLWPFYIIIFTTVCVTSIKIFLLLCGILSFSCLIFNFIFSLAIVFLPLEDGSLLSILIY